jgi:hypothetical protein
MSGRRIARRQVSNKNFAAASEEARDPASGLNQRH